MSSIPTSTNNHVVPGRSGTGPQQHRHHSTVNARIGTQPTAGGASSSSTSSTTAFVSITNSAKDATLKNRQPVPRTTSTNTVANSDAVRRSGNVSNQARPTSKATTTVQPPPQLSFRTSKVPTGTTLPKPQRVSAPALQPSDPNTYEHQQQLQRKNKFPINNHPSNNPDAPEQQPSFSNSNAPGAFSSWSVESSLIPATQPVFSQSQPQKQQQPSLPADPQAPLPVPQHFGPKAHAVTDEGDALPNPALPGATATYRRHDDLPAGPPPPPSVDQDAAQLPPTAGSCRPPLSGAPSPFRSLTTPTAPAITAAIYEAPPTPSKMKSLLTEAMVLTADSFFMVPATANTATAAPPTAGSNGTTSQGEDGQMVLPPSSLDMVAHQLRQCLGPELDPSKTEQLSRTGICSRVKAMLTESADTTFANATWLTDWTSTERSSKFTKQPLLVLDDRLCELLSLSQGAVQQTLHQSKGVHNDDSQGESCSPLPSTSGGSSPLVASMTRGLTLHSAQTTPLTNPLAKHQEQHNISTTCSQEEAQHLHHEGEDDADRTVGPKFHRLHRLPSPGEPALTRRFTPTGNNNSTQSPATMPAATNAATCMDTLLQQEPPIDLCMEVMRQVYSIAPTLKTQVRRDPAVALVLTHRCCRYLCLVHQRLAVAVEEYNQNRPYSSFSSVKYSGGGRPHPHYSSNYLPQHHQTSSAPMSRDASTLPVDHPFFNLAHMPPICIVLAIACYTAIEYSQNAFFNQQLNRLMITEGEAAGREASKSGDPRYQDVSMWKVVQVLYKKHYHRGLRPLTSGKLTRLQAEILMCVAGSGGATSPTVAEVLLNATEPGGKTPLLADTKCTLAARKDAAAKEKVSSSTGGAATEQRDLGNQQVIMAALLDDVCRDAQLQTLSCSNDAAVFLASSALVAASL